MFEQKSLKPQKCICVSMHVYDKQDWKGFQSKSASDKVPKLTKLWRKEKEEFEVKAEKSRNSKSIWM